MSRRSFLALLTSAALLASGCSRKEVYKYRIAVIPKGLTHEHWQSVKRGAERAAADLKAAGIPVEILWDGPTDEGNALQQINLIEQKTVAGVNGLVLAPQDSKQMVPPVEAALDKGLPVVIIDSDLDLKRDLLVKYVATDNYAGGRLAAQKLLEALPDKKKLTLVLLRYQTGSESTQQREQGFLDYVNEHRGGRDIKIIDNEYAGSNSRTAQDAANRLFSRADAAEFDGIFAVNESATAGLLSYMNNNEDRDYFGKVKVVGFDSSAYLLKELRAGHLVGLVVQDPYRMGYLGVWVIVQHLEGYDVSAGGRYLSTGEEFLTRENVDTPEMQGRFNPDAQAKRTIPRPEFKKK
jgi:ribose transport system substrate-binding protein